MNRFAYLFLVLFIFPIALSIAACGSEGQGGGGTNQNPTTPTVAVTPASSSITTAQTLSLSISVTGSGGTPAGSVALSSGSYTSSSATLSSGSATITIPAGSLSAGSDMLTAKYTPDSASSSSYNSASGTASVIVTQPTTTPTVTVTPASSNISSTQSLGVTITVAATGATPTGSVVLSSGSYTSSSAALNSGTATITIPSGSLAAGSDMLTAEYTPDTNSSSTYSSASGSASVTVTQSLPLPTVAVTPEEITHPYAENLIVTASVNGGSGTPTGSVVLSSGSFTSSAVTLSSGAATFYVQPGSLPAGSDTLTVAYTPDANSASTYAASAGTVGMTITAPGTTSVAVNINTLANRHLISPYIYGINSFTQSDITNLSPALVRFGGNEATNYNWKLFTYNAGGDWYYEDFGLGGVDSVGLTQYTVNSGSHMLATMPMLNWVARESENGSNHNWSFSVATYGAQCSTDPNNPDAGNGLKPGSTGNCNTSTQPVTSNASTGAYYPLVDTASDCATGNCLYRDEWAQALSTASGSSTCNVPYTQITSCHFYDMDNEPEIWNGSHRDVHPVQPGYSELANLFEAEGAALKTWDPGAVRFGPITCCYYFLWMAGSSTDGRGTHAGIDFVPWWLNQVNWQDRINGTRTLDVFDIHAYFGDNISTTGFTNPQMRAEVGKYLRTYWDPTYYNSGDDADWITTTQPNRGVTFLIPRLKALVNATYPGTPLSFTEWESFFNEWEFATALSDADAFGVMGREGLSFSTRWGGPSATDTNSNQPHPNYQSFKLWTNYDGARHGFGILSVADQSSANPDVFVTYAALDATGKTMTIMVLNKDPDNKANVTFNLTGFNATTYTGYTVGSTNPGSITTSSTQSWSTTQTFAPYSITLLVVSGTQPSMPATEWNLNPDDLMIPATGTGILNPKIESGTSPVTLTSAIFDAFEGATACSGTIALTSPTLTTTTPATLTVNPGSTPGFCHYTVTGSDGTSTQTEGGWIVVGKPAAALAINGGNNQSGSSGTALSQSLAVTLSSIPSGFSNTGASVLFTASAGTLSNGTTTGTSVIATTNSSGMASVTLTLPSTTGAVTVTAQDQFALGGASVIFTETAK